MHYPPDTFGKRLMACQSAHDDCWNVQIQYLARSAMRQPKLDSTTKGKNLTYVLKLSLDNINNIKSTF